MTDTRVAKFMEYIERKHGEETWITVYKQVSSPDSSEDGGFYCGLIAKDFVNEALDHYTWDTMYGYDAPGLASGYEDGVQVVKYVASEDDSVQRLIICREFEGSKPSYREILEEFRLFHNLYQDNSSSKFVTVDEAGDEVEVAIISESEVKIRRSYLRSFLAAKQVDLLLFFDMTYRFADDISLEGDLQADNLRVNIYCGNAQVKGFRTLVRIVGKKLIRSGPVEQSGVYPFKNKEYEEYLIGGDVEQPEKFSSNPEGLANYFGANPDAPHYLTPVFFRKDVMQKYYGSSDYEILDSRLSRNGSWSLRLDNNALGHISVFLGDLGRDLPFREQQYWKSFNIFPEDRQISNTYYQRSFLGGFFNPESPEHQFKHAFAALRTSFSEKHGWPLFLQLSPKDLHFFESIRSMLTNQQSEFDAMILGVAKSTIDSLNVKGMKGVLGDSEESRSIVLLELFLNQQKVGKASEIAQFLKGVQAVRSAGVAHRKGTEYDKVVQRMDLDEDNYQAEFDEILRKFVWCFDQIVTSINPEQDAVENAGTSA